MERLREAIEVRVVAVLLVWVLSAVSAQANVVAYWGFDDSDLYRVKEERGGKDGAIVGTLEPVDGRIGRALRFNGDGAYVQINHDPVFDISEAITVAAWMKVDAFDKFRQTLIAKGDSAWRLDRERHRNVMRFAANSGDDWWGVVGQTSVNDQRWHHIVGVFDGAHAYLYIDGRLDASIETSTRVGSNSYAISIGDNSERPGRSWQGSIDDVLILNHALSASEVQHLCDVGARSLIREMLGMLGGAISDAEKILAEQGPRRAITFVEGTLRESERRERQSPSEVKPSHRMIRSELSFLLAQAHQAAGSQQHKIIEATKQTVTLSLRSRTYVPALLYLYENTAGDDYAEAVRQSVRGNHHAAEDSHLVARQFESRGNWMAFEQFLNAAFSASEDPLALAKGIGQGLPRPSRWSQRFAEYCRARPRLRPYYILTQTRLAEESVQRNEFMVAAAIYDGVVVECETERDAARYALKACECVFRDGQYRRAIAQIDQFRTQYGVSNKPLARRASLLQGQAYLQLDDMDHALTVFAGLSAGASGSDAAAEAGFFAGYCNMLRKDLDEASRLLIVVAEEYPQSSFANKARLCLRHIEKMGQ